MRDWRLEVVDPTGGRLWGEGAQVTASLPQVRLNPERLRGLRCGLLDNSKPGSERLLRELGRQLADRYGVRIGPFVVKGFPSVPATEEELRRVTEDVDLVLTGVGD
ncbi:MAG: hypothetical protein QN172_05425 [Armatimonadota bacterium]|nr:hypothetical protein [Armatimonadota bacterium]MDR7439375.1 hypothetical protein [Armatimonadota bacterium]MDR7563214.1 hypothetical protein [Armatimonadota bacterium]MDR7567953.1 hypothetical protein [Armatimonadota bacterium]MDR7601882.1 hypothetical protein [Armatimonadota bacterium]